MTRHVEAESHRFESKHLLSIKDILYLTSMSSLTLFIMPFSENIGNSSIISVWLIVSNFDVNFF